MGCILTGDSAILLILSGFSAPLVGILVIGIVLAGIGFHRKPTEERR
jgi:hypothetical protein